MKVIQQSNSQIISFGPFVDKTDGFTELSGLVSALDNATTGIMLSKNGGTFAVRHATVTTSVYDSHGYYKITLDATDTNTLGLLRVMYSDPTTCLPVWEDCLVIPAAVKAPLAGTALLTTNVTQWLTAAAPAMTGDAFASLATLLTRIASAVTITNGKVDVNDKTGFSLTSLAISAISNSVWQSLTSAMTTVGSIGKKFADWVIGTTQTADVANVAAAVLAGTVEDSITVAHAMQIILAACAGKSDGGGNATIHFRDQADSKNRITATVDANGNRTAITLSYD